MNELFDSAIDDLKRRDFRSFRRLLDTHQGLVYHANEEFGGLRMIHVCSAVNFIAGVLLLLDKQVDVNIQSPKGYTPLQYACERGHGEMVQILLDKQADVDTQCTLNRATPL
jgi:hypothetical protein